ncbi:MAG: TIGR03435 family protein [Acidobacteriia bacterium]|nr:TIGR03435 family protein [Terriglobia bacterium]
MTKWMLRIIALATLPASALLAQDITGTWQGKLAVPQAPNGELRIVVKIAKGDAGALKATLYSIDQPGPGIPASAITLQGNNVKFTVPAIGGTYEGKLDSDAVNLTGNWTQGPKPLPLTLAHVTDKTAWEIPAPPPPPKMMAADANPAFEVATIKPSDPSRPGKLFSIRGGEVFTINTTVDDLITFAYGVHVRQVTGAPAWVESDKFDINGKPEGGALPNLNQFKVMVQKLLADRFQLVFHRDKKELTVYALTVGKNGPKLTKSESAGTVPALLFRGLGNLPARNATMEEFAGVMQGAVLDRPVVDQTGIQGRWDFQLLWTPDETQFAALRGPGPLPAPPDGAETQPDLFTAIQKQLGLKLESTKAPTEVFVVDKVEKPSSN